MKIGIIGMGALGVLYAHYFYDQLGADSVSFLMDESRFQKYKGTPITFNQKEYLFALETPETNLHYDIILFAVKGPGLADAVELAKTCASEDTVFLSVLNGISSEELIKQAFGVSRFIYAVALGMDTLKEGPVVSSAHFGNLHIGYIEGQEQTYQLIKTVLNMAGVPLKEEKDILRRLWSKWMLNIGVNQVVMIYEGTYKTVQQVGEARTLMIDAMHEVVQLSELEGVNLTSDDVEFYLKIVDGLNPDSMPSMRQDGLYKRPSEVELFAGACLNIANKHQLNLPINRELYQKIKQMEESY